MNQRTRTVKENNSPAYNETLFFEVPLNKEYIKDPEKYIQKINEEFITKNEVTFSLMIEGDDNTYDNLGVAYFHLSDIKNGEMSYNKFYADNLKRIREYSSRKVTAKEKISSAFSQSSNTYIHFDAWFLSDFPDSVDFGEKIKKREDAIPAQLKKYLEKNKKDIERLSEDFHGELTTVFKLYTKYTFKERLFNNFLISDQYEFDHLMPYFLSPITPPVKLYSKEEKVKSNFFDTNLKSLDDIAHYVRCYVLPHEQKRQIWSSPDLMMKVRKGTIEDHALLLASMMLGLRERNENLYFVEETPTYQDGTPGEKNEEDVYLNPINEEVNFPFENRVFVCLGKLKFSKEPYSWVMTFSADYRDVTFWDPVLPHKYELPGRVKNPEKLKDYLTG